MSFSPLSCPTCYRVSKKDCSWTRCIQCQNLSNIFFFSWCELEEFCHFYFLDFAYICWQAFFSCTMVFCYSNKTTVAGKTDFLHFLSLFFPCIDFTLHESDEGEIQRKLESINHIMSQEWNYQPPNQELGAPRSRMYPSHCKFLYFICLSLFTNVCPETTSDKSVIYVKHNSKQNLCHQQK